MSDAEERDESGTPEPSWRTLPQELEGSLALGFLAMLPLILVYEVAVAREFHGPRSTAELLLFRLLEVFGSHADQVRWLLLTVAGAVAFGYMHPMVLTLSIIVAIVLPTRHVAGEIEKGTLELLFSLPIKRSAVVLSLWVFSGMALLGLVIGGWMGSGVGLWLFPEARSVPILGIAKAGLNLWLLMFAISSYTLLISAYAREGGQATLRAAGLTLLFFFLNTIAIFWPTIDFLGLFSIFYYHKPQLVMMDASVLGRNVAVLVGVILVCGALAVRQVRRRDIPG